MTFQELGAIGEFVGGIGVIVSLIYLALQIRQTSRIERLNARQAVSQSMSRVLDMIDNDADLQRIWSTAIETGDEPTGEDRERLGRFLFRFFGEMNNADSFSELDPKITDRFEPLLMRFLRVPAVKGWWGRQHRNISEPFRSKVDARLREIGAVAD